MIKIESRHKPVFSMSSVRKICNFAEENFFVHVNDQFGDLSLSLETTIRINEINHKIINYKSQKTYNQHDDNISAKIPTEDILIRLKSFSLESEEFHNELISYKSNADLQERLPGNYLFYSEYGKIPDLSVCHAFFAINNGLKLEVSLNRFEDTRASHSVLLIGAVII